MTRRSIAAGNGLVGRVLAALMLGGCVTLAGYTVPILFADTGAPHASASPKPGEPGGNHSKPGDNKKKKKRDNDNNNSSGSDRGSNDQRSGQPSQQPRVGNGRSAEDGTNRTVQITGDQRAPEYNPPQYPQQSQAPVTSAPPPPPSTQAPPPPAQTQTQVPARPVQQQLPMDLIRPAPDNTSNDNTGPVVLGAAAAAGALTRRRYTRSPLTSPIVEADPDVVNQQLQRVNEARQGLDTAQQQLDSAAVARYTWAPDAPSPDASLALGQQVFDARAQLTDQTLMLAQLNGDLTELGRQPVEVPELPPGVNVQSYPPEPSTFVQASEALNQGSLGLIPDVAHDYTTITNFGAASTGDRVTLGLDAASMIPGVGTLGRLGERGFDGVTTLLHLGDDIPTGAVPTQLVPNGPSVITEATAQGGQIVYHGLDAAGRPTGISAHVTPDLLGTGTAASPNLPITGWAPTDAADGFARGHLLAKVLGGSGSQAANIVKIIQNPVNTPVMYGFEKQVLAAVRAGETVNYAVTPLYRGAEVMPEAIQIIAEGSTLHLAVTVLNR